MGNIFTKKTNNGASADASRGFRDNCYITQIKNINEEELDLSNIDKLQIKVLKEMIKELKEVKDRKSDKMTYKLPALNLCSYSLF